MNIYCDRYSECNSMYLDRGANTEAMAQARGWVIWRGATMGGQEQEVKLCDKCVEASRRRLHRHNYEALPGQYPIPELTVVRMNEPAPE
jgi:hypothetical protein